MKRTGDYWGITFLIIMVVIVFALAIVGALV